MSAKPWRWFKRIVLGTLTLIVVAVATLLIVLHTDWGRGIVRSQVETQLNKTFVGGAKVGKIEGSAFGELTLRDVVINGPDKKPAISIRTLRLRLGLMPLLSDQVRLGGLVAEDVDVDLRRDPDGQLQITRLTRPNPGPKSNWSIEIPTIQVHRTHVRFDPGGGQPLVNLDAIEIAGSAMIPANGPLDASVNVTANWRERGNLPIAITTAVHKDPEVLTVPTLVASAGAIKVAASEIKVWGGESPVIGGTLTLQAPKAELERIVPGLQAYNLDISLEAVPVTEEGRTQISLSGSVDQAKLGLFANVHIGQKHAVGMLSTGEIDVTKFSGGKVVGSGSTFVMFDVAPGKPGDLPTANAMILASGEMADLPPADVAMAVSTQGQQISASIGAVNDALTAAISGIIHKRGDAISLEAGRIVASTPDPKSASGGKAPVRGHLAVDLTASGAISPKPSLAVKGKIDGSKLRFQDISIAVSRSMSMPSGCRRGRSVTSRSRRAGSTSERLHLRVRPDRR